ncbi:hypothetical protein AVEN_62448-1 [Araneus ventricosus]|uniref:Uncharacterized protein n=1 Tax=Araneus ventricosus TaxID=182803 RepID=A0A4Y2TL03_ARAVE|nr:hypothetical protein AVEN_51565-1 [Araneus ventricosus]GBO01363.1 hypothetical protein AVEN_62448-1 [Araneus ventricosus]
MNYYQKVGNDDVFNEALLNVRGQNRLPFLDSQPYFKKLIKKEVTALFVQSPNKMEIKKKMMLSPTKSDEVGMAIQFITLRKAQNVLKKLNAVSIQKATD